MKIAVVGAGISGLVCALELSRDHEVVVYESANRAGGHAHTITVTDDKNLLAIDTGFIVFNYEHYPHLSALFDQLGVKSQASEMSFSVCCDESGFEYSGSNLSTFFAQRRNLLRLESWQLLGDILRFNRDAKVSLDDGIEDRVTVGGFAERFGYSASFIDHYLLPLGGALWSCGVDTFRDFPVRFVLEFLRNHAMLQIGNRPVWRTVSGGAQEYVRRIVAQLGERVRLDHPVARVARVGRGIEIHLANGQAESYDEIVLASHADTSLALLERPEAEECEVLSAFPYQDNSVCLHTDISVLPQSTRAWASWNYRLPKSGHAQNCVTYNMNKLQALETDQTYCVSLNQSDRLDPRRVLRKETVRHPMFTLGRDAAQASHLNLIRRRGVSYCGAYWGFGFHEDGVRSAVAVCDAFGVARTF